MPLPASSIVSLPDVLRTIQNNAQAIKGRAQDAVASLAAGSVNTEWVFALLDNLKGLISTLNSWKNVAGLNGYATSNLPGYAGTMTTDIDAVISAAQACIDWVTVNFPKDSTNTYILAETLNADGGRTQRLFTSAQTAGLRTLLNSFISTIG